MPVPDLKGDSIDEARTLLTSLGLKIGTSTQVDDSDVDKGKIVSTDPASGQTIAVGLGGQPQRLVRAR